ncbi:MAG TPA: hypothetical protein DIV39_00050 [Verrucomicrobiales bacterium]|nr:hypothetical protein [Verrucomicrobiales bacterium]
MVPRKFRLAPSLLSQAQPEPEPTRRPESGVVDTMRSGVQSGEKLYGIIISTVVLTDTDLEFLLTRTSSFNTHLK